MTIARAPAVAYGPFVGKCMRCGLAVTKRWSPEAGAFVPEQHDAPCGLRCQEGAGHFIDVHQGPGHCPRCATAQPKRRARRSRRRPNYRRLA
jgi:hypothetical protein